VEPKWAPVLCQLPKGRVHPNESLEEAALREVLEETGYNAEIRRYAGRASWQTPARITEYVHYFLMTPLVAVPQEHDDEFDEVKWLSVSDALEALSYPEEREILGLVDFNKQA
jgi:bis(5'-nucleosidyl)-tetraphosphatase